MFTQEQQSIINLVLSPESDNKIVAVNAVAGSGKSSTAKGIIEAFKPSKGLYTAFNKSVVEEAKIKLKDYKIDARTMHSLAYSYAGYQNIKELSYNMLPDDIDYSVKSLILEALDKFYRSKYTNLQSFIRDKYNDEYLYSVCRSTLQKIINKELPASFNFLLKAMHFKLVNNEINPTFDLLILDECQDTVEVVLEIFKLLECKKKVILGDTHQNIYNFMGTVNAFTELDKDVLIIKNLTQSFRCNSDIADQVDTFGKNYFNNDFIYKGTTLPLFDETNTNNVTVHLVRHNMALINILSNVIGREKNFKLMREPKEIFAYALSLLSASLGKEVYYNQFKHLETIYKQFEFDENTNNVENSLLSKQYRYFNYLLKVTDYDEQLEFGISMLKTFSRNKINLFELYKEAEEKNNPNAKYILSTVHTYKGLEAEKVIIDNSLVRSVEKTKELLQELELSVLNGELTLEEKEQFIKDNAEKYIEPYNLYYVALSRAKYIIEGNLL